MTEIYPNSFLAEVLFEVNFESNEDWDWTIPSEYYNKIKNVFPKKKQENGLIFNIENKDKDFYLNQSATEETNKLIFINDKDQIFIQITPQTFTINFLEYKNWDYFSSEAKKYFDMYKEMLSEAKIRDMKLRYINKFEKQSFSSDYSNYFKIMPKVPIDKRMNKFLIKNELDYEELNSSLYLTVGNPLSDVNFIVFDFNFMTTNQKNMEEYNNWLDNAHKSIKSAFESCITDKAREILNKEVE